MISDFLLDDRFDEWISNNLMYQLPDEWFGPNEIKDSGKSGDLRIYKALKEIEKVKKIKL
jgi:hypothetical protein